MKRSALCTLLGLTVLSTPALALDVPKPAGPDLHVRTVIYNLADTTLLVGTVNSPTTITFAQDEQVKTVAFGQGDNPPWRGPQCKNSTQWSPRNNLSLWPTKPGRNSMEVITVRTANGATEERAYAFVLIALAQPASCAELDNLLQDPECQDAHSMSELRFTYKPDAAEVAREAQAHWEAARRVELEHQAEARLATDYFNGQRNWKYVAKANRAWLASGQPAPSVSDNGTDTVFGFRGYAQQPAIFVVLKDHCGDPEHDDCEQSANVTPTPQHGFVVYHGMAPHFRLRLGAAVMDIWNKAYDPIGHNPDTGTTSPDVVRQVVRAEP
jgi:type IV secretion system protein VirB9